MKTWMWVTLAVVVIVLIVYFVYQSNQSKNAQLQANMLAGSQYQGSTSGGSKIADILGAVLPFYQTYKSSQTTKTEQKASVFSGQPNWSACTTSDFKAGHWMNGICIAN